MSIRTRLAVRLAATGLLIVLGLPGVAGAQHPGAAGSAPPPPPGDGVLTVQVRHNTSEPVVAGITVALYALGPGGTPGFATSLSDSEGLAVFSGISTNPEIVYLVGVSHREIPFGERIRFAVGESAARVEVEISSPTDQVGKLQIEELRVRVDWMGDRIRVREIQRIANPGNRVILLPTDQPRSITARPLPVSAADFAAGPTAIGEGLILDDGHVRFLGPLYPGEQSVEYEYSLPIEGLAGSLPIRMREELGRVVIVAGTPGIEASAPNLIASSPLPSESGQPLASWARARLGAQQQLDVAITLPEIRRDASLVTISRTDIWLELDDARLSAQVDMVLDIPPGTPLAGTPEAPLLRIDLPNDATLNGVAAEAEALGLIPSVDGGFDMIGPVAAGQTNLAYSYSMPAGRDGVQLGLRFPSDVGTLNVLIADTELELESSRLHRRRPFRSGTRNFLHREAYHVSAEEVVDLSIAPIQIAQLPRLASGALAFLALAAGAFFLVSPLISREPREDGEVDREWTPIRTEREGIYANIRDLDHDFETGKLEADDYHPMRNELRDRAIELLRMEREGRLDSASSAESPPSMTNPAPSPDLSSSAAKADPTADLEIKTGAFCPGCGGPAKPTWHFCTHCGEKLDPVADATQSPGATEASG